MIVRSLWGSLLEDMLRWHVLMIVLRILLDWCCLDAVLIVGAVLASFPGSIVPLSRPSFRKTVSPGCRKKHFEACFQQQWSSPSSKQDSHGKWRHVSTVNWYPTTSLRCFGPSQAQSSSSMEKTTSRTGKGRQHCSEQPKMVSFRSSNKPVICVIWNSPKR